MNARAGPAVSQRRRESPGGAGVRTVAAGVGLEPVVQHRGHKHAGDHEAPHAGREGARPLEGAADHAFRHRNRLRRHNQVAIGLMRHQVAHPVHALREHKKGGGHTIVTKHVECVQRACQRVVLG